MDTTSIILKTDQLGRVRTPPDRREALLAEFARSGLPATKFAALAGVRYQTFATWVQRSRRGKKVRRSLRRSKVRLVEAMVPARCEIHATSSACALSVHLASGVRLEIAHESQARLAAALLKALESARPC